jgi:hypothetical protein
MFPVQNASVLLAPCWCSTKIHRKSKSMETQSIYRENAAAQILAVSEDMGEKNHSLTLLSPFAPQTPLQNLQGSPEIRIKSITINSPCTKAN